MMRRRQVLADIGIIYGFGEEKMMLIDPRKFVLLSLNGLPLPYNPTLKLQLDMFTNLR